MSDPGRARPLLLGLGWPPDQTGGLNRYFRDLLEALDDATAVVVGPARDAPATVQVVSRHDAPLARRLRTFDRAAQQAAAAADVVDAHFALYAALPIRHGAAGRLPLVVHFHGPWAAEHEAEARSRGGRAAVSRGARQRLERSVYRRADRVLTLSGAFARLLIEDYGVSPWRVRILPPGVALHRFTPGDRGAARRTLGVPEDTRVVLTVRRLVHRTGVDVLLDAWSRIDVPGCLLVVAGDGPARPALERAAAQRGRTDVRFVGAPDDRALIDWYRAADVTVVPSRSLEGYGLVVLESLAAGTPAIVTDSGGLPESVAALDPGLVVPANDPAALAARLRGALDGSEPLPDRARCRAVAERADWAAVAERTRAVYDEARTAPVGPHRLRVVFVDHVARLSGGELALLRLLDALDPSDALDGEVDTTIAAHVITFEDGPLLPALGAAGVTTEIVAMPARTTELSRDRVRRRLPFAAVFDTTAQVVRLTRRFRRLQPDVVHANSLKSCLMAGVAARLARVPCVWHVRDIVMPESYGHVATRLVRGLARRVPTVVLANSEATLAALRLPTGRGPERLVVPDPLPDSFFTAPPTARDEQRDDLRDGDELVVGIVGRLAPWKGQHVFLDAFATAFPDGGARARVVGDALFGEDDYRASLHEQAARLGIADRVEFRGFRHDVQAELAELDVLVHATVTAEPFGQVIVEGMAAGLPVVATDTGGPAEILTNGVDGLLVPPGSTTTLAAVLSRLADDPGLRRTLGRRAREHAERYRGRRVAPIVAGAYLRIEGIEDIESSR